MICYGSYLGRFGQVERRQAERAAAIASALETRLMRVWAEPLAEGSRDVAPVVDLIRVACDAAAPAGITVVIERHLGSFADSVDSIERLLRDVDWPNVALNYQVLDFLPPREAVNQPADAARLAVSKSQGEDPILRVVKLFEDSMALDTVRNEYLLHRRIHERFAEGVSDTTNADALNEWVYAELFLTPSSDPWLGLAPRDVYTALEGDGRTVPTVEVARSER